MKKIFIIALIAFPITAFGMRGYIAMSMMSGGSDYELSNSKMKACFIWNKECYRKAMIERCKEYLN